MPSAARRWAVVLAFLGVAAAAPVCAAVRLAGIFGNGMVLQRDAPVPVWGWADPGEIVTVRFAGQEAAAQAGADGRWMVRLNAMEAGGPYEMTVAGADTVTVRDILVGEVWVCSGQSNMAWQVRSAKDAATETAAADYPMIRHAAIPSAVSGYPEADVRTSWTVCTPKTVSAFTAVGYFFGRELHTKLGVPVGLINTSWGGTRIEPWTPPEGFAMVEGLKAVSDKVAGAEEAYRKAVAGSLPAVERWLVEAREALEKNKRIPAPAVVAHPLASHVQPTGIYNAMAHPLLPYAIRGAIWYQGEANRNEGAAYTDKMRALVGGWRKVWGQGEFPFYFVQLAPCRFDATMPAIWEAQADALDIPNTGMAVTVDIGDMNDIHPRNKQDVGKRLALWALAKTYGVKDLVYSGPLFKSAAVEGNKVRVAFDHVGGGLVSTDGQPLRNFEVTADGKAFVKAQARIDGATVLVWSDDIAVPAAARYLWTWQGDPNLANKEGLPAPAFRTAR